MTREELLAAIDGSRKLLEIANVLARAAASGDGWARDDLDAERVARARQRGVEVLKAVAKVGVLGAAGARRIAAIAAELCATSVPLAGAQLLSAFDEGTGPDLGHLVEAAGGQLELAPGQVFPVGRPNLKALLAKDGRFTAQTAKLARPDLRLSHVGVLPQVLGAPRVVFDFDAGAAMSGLVERKTIATLWPNERSFDAFEVGLDCSQNRFFDLRPIDEADQRSRIFALLDQADRAGAAVAMLPELASTPALDREIGSWVSRKARSISMVIAGSHHVRTAAAHDNRCATHVPGRPAFEHDKFNPFEWKGELGQFTERLDARPAIVVRWSRGVTFTTLICKDLLEPALVHVLLALRVNFVFVPTLSGETREFDVAQALATNAQTVVVICNQVPEGAAGHAALLFLPTRGPDARLPPGPRAATADLGQAAPVWTAL